MGAGARYWEHVVGIGAANPVTKQLQNVNCSIGKRGTHIQKDGARGTVSQLSETVSDGPYTVGGSLTIQPSDDELRELLPWIMGTAEQGAGPFTYPLADTGLERFVTQDKKTKVFTWTGCKVNRATFRCSAANPQLTVELDVMGLTETVANSGTFPAISATLTADQPFLHHQLVFTHNAIAYNLDDLAVTIDNQLDGSNFKNSQSRLDLVSNGRLVTADLSVAYGTPEAALYGLAVAGAVAELKWTNGTRILDFDFINLKAPDDVIEGAQGGEVTRRLSFTAYQNAAGVKELVTTLTAG